jgi:hypothetical protein
MIPLEKQVCSLDLAKQLKELGIAQESYFWWVPWWEDETQEIPAYELVHTRNEAQIANECYSAFTVVELGEMIENGNFTVKEGDQWHCKSQYRVYEIELSDTEADARAKMLICLVEKKLVTL